MMVNGRQVDMFTKANRAAATHMNIRNIDSIDAQLHEILLLQLDKILMQEK